MSQMIATEIKRLTDYTGDARLFKLSPPLKTIEWDDDTEKEYEYVVVSATNAMFSGPETYIFPANEEGEVVNWSELDGSYKGGLDHVQALRGAGYEVAR